MESTDVAHHKRCTHIFLDITNERKSEEKETQYLNLRRMPIISTRVKM